MRFFYFISFIIQSQILKTKFQIEQLTCDSTQSLYFTQSKKLVDIFQPTFSILFYRCRCSMKTHFIVTKLFGDGLILIFHLNAYRMYGS